MATESNHVEEYLDIFRKILPLPIIQFETNIVNHCNLNCRSCDHISPLSDKWFADVFAFQKDMERMAEIFDSQARYVRLVGGEPLLHPSISSFFRIARNCFPNASVELWTNALLLTEMNEDFWVACKQFDILINVTKYPISLDYANISAIAERKFVRLKFFDNGKTVNSFNNNSFDLTGQRDTRTSFLLCPNANRHITLAQGGLIYPCDKAPHISILNRYFGTTLKVSNRDFINIHTDITAEDIFQFLSRPIPFCRYCNISERMKESCWARSKREINEWVLDASHGIPDNNQADGGN